MSGESLPSAEPSEEASSLPVVAWFASGELYHTKDGIPFRHLPPVGEIHALVLLSVAQSQLNAMRVERDDALRKYHEWHAEALSRSTELAALKAAPVVDVERIMALAEKMMRDSWATGDDSAWHPARDELRAALASPEGSQHD